MVTFPPQSRQSIAKTIQKKVPAHWKVTIGEKGDPTVVVDQDGERPEYRFPEIGTQVVVIEKAPDDDVIRAVAYERVKCPPGFTEARKKVRVLASGTVPGWQDKISRAVQRYVQKVEAEAAKEE